jgi:2-polyprenyl-6-methoxyphenol hydroxylase-like FAD-dependent oxidoreductase
MPTQLTPPQPAPDTIRAARTRRPSARARRPSTHTRHRTVAVVGAGASGTLTASQLLRRSDARVVLVDPDRAGLWSACSTLLASADDFSRVEIVRARVEGVAERLFHGGVRLTLSNGRELSADAVILAHGGASTGPRIQRRSRASSAIISNAATGLSGS